jgi:hypothetical protein
LSLGRFPGGEVFSLELFRPNADLGPPIINRRTIWILIIGIALTPPGTAHKTPRNPATNAKLQRGNDESLMLCGDFGRDPP